MLGEPGGVVELEVAVHLVGRDVVQTGAVRACCLQQRERAHDVGLQERIRVVQRVVVVRLGGIVDDRVGGPPHQLVDQSRVGDVAANEGHAVVRQTLERREVAGVGQFVQHGDVMIGVVDDVVHEVRADEAGTAGDQQPHHRPRSSRSSRYVP